MNIASTHTPAQSGSSGSCMCSTLLATRMATAWPAVASQRRLHRVRKNGGGEELCIQWALDNAGIETSRQYGVGGLE